MPKGDAPKKFHAPAKSLSTNIRPGGTFKTGSSVPVGRPPVRNQPIRRPKVAGRPVDPTKPVVKKIKVNGKQKVLIKKPKKPANPAPVGKRSGAANVLKRAKKLRKSHFITMYNL